MDIMKALDMLSDYLDGLSEYAEMTEEELNDSEYLMFIFLMLVVLLILM